MSKIWTGETGLIVGETGVIVCDECPCEVKMVEVCNCESGWPSVLGVSWTNVNDGSCSVCNTIFDGTRYALTHAGSPTSICAGFAGNGDVWLSAAGVFDSLAGECSGLLGRSIGVRLSTDRFLVGRCVAVVSIFANSDRATWLSGSFCGSPGTCSGGFCMNAGSPSVFSTCPSDVGNPWEFGINDGSGGECTRVGATARIHFS